MEKWVGFDRNWHKNILLWKCSTDMEGLRHLCLRDISGSYLIYVIKLGKNSGEDSIITCIIMMIRIMIIFSTHWRVKGQGTEDLGAIFKNLNH